MSTVVNPRTFQFVSFDAGLTASVVDNLHALLGLDRSVRVEVDETTPLARIRTEIGDEIVLHVESGALEDTRKPRQQSEAATTANLARALLRARDRISGGFGDAPPDDQLDLRQVAAWDTYAVGRLERMGIAANQQRWKYNFRNRHGFTDAADAGFERIWASDGLTWGELESLSTAARATSEREHLMNTQRIAVRDVELVVHIAGDPSNPAIVLSHGFPELAHSWRHQMQPLADAGWLVIAPDQRGYGFSSAPRQVEAYGVNDLTGDLFALLDHFGKETAVFCGHDWGALVVWECARLRPERVRSVIGVSVPYVEWPGPPTQLFRMLYTDRFFYMLYFQQVGPPEAELDADPAHSMAMVLYNASGEAAAGRELPTELPPMEGTGFLTQMNPVPPFPFMGPEGPWLTEAEFSVYAKGFTNSGFFGPVSWYRNLDANYELVKGLGADRLSMPSYFITGEVDVVRLMDPTGPERMRSQLPDYRGDTIIQGAGHWVQQEAPQAFNAALLGFLATL